MATNLSSIIPASQARMNLFDIIKKIQQPETRFIITIDGRPKAVMISADEWESIVATLDIATDPKMVKAIKRGEKDIKEKKYYTLDEILSDEGLEIIRDKSIKYKVKKGNKRIKTR
ncbi:MAG: type II toxin-antitoxin system Phd/YefM family antitoxin [Patescibacteria group bacterium]